MSALSRFRTHRAALAFIFVTAVLDIDSDQFAAFDQTDATALERLVKSVFTV